MIFGVLHETFANEKRVCLTPNGAGTLTKLGYTVLVESGAGEASGFLDQQYLDKGAKIVFNAEEVYGRSDVLLKVLSVDETALEHMTEGQTVLTFQHLSVSSPQVIEGLIKKKITLIGMEIMEEKE